MHRRLIRHMLARMITAVSQVWPPYSRLALVSDRAAWVLLSERRELAALARRLQIRVLPSQLGHLVQKQSVFLLNQFQLMKHPWENSANRIAVAYFHGRPGSSVPEFDSLYQVFKENHHHIHRVQVSHSEMQQVLLEGGIDPNKIHLIPIGINLAIFPFHTPKTRQSARRRLGIPFNATVVGSFQKDGEGWGEGLSPKLIKGPDIFLEVIARIKEHIPDLFILLSGPARGYVIHGLESMGVPYRYCFVHQYNQMASLYHALDLYLITSRQEGGPKALLECMASGVPLVSTRVGQAMDMVQTGKNGWLVNVGDVDGLAHWAEFAISHPSETASVVSCARQTAEQHAYTKQLPLWADFFRGFVSCEK